MGIPSPGTDASIVSTGPGGAASIFSGSLSMGATGGGARGVGRL